MSFPYDKDGYLKTALRDCNGKRKYFRVHRLIAMTFIPNPHNYPIVNHKNGIKDDNRVENLEWCTISKNTKHGFEALGRKIDGSRYEKKVFKIDEDGNIVALYNSLTIASKEHNVSIQSICNAIRKGYKSCGYKWVYAK